SELRDATLDAAKNADAVIMAAAPADFRPATFAPEKIKKADGGVAPVLELATNPDIAAELGANKPAGRVLVVFAAETAELSAAIVTAKEKLARKRADLIVLNQVGVDRTFGSDLNAAILLDVAGETVKLGERSK